MKVFISWSGDRSRAYAEAIRKWLPKVIQSVKPFCSSDDIRAGSRWLVEIMNQLDSTDFGLLCMTADNREAPWLVFEAGALAKKVSGSRVVPILFSIEPNDLKPPLTQFQSKVFDRNGFLAAVLEINRAISEIRRAAGEKEDLLDNSALEEIFDKWWPDLERAIRTIDEAAPAPKAPKREVPEMLEELLTLARSTSGVVSRDSQLLQALGQQWLRDFRTRSRAQRTLSEVASTDADSRIALSEVLREWGDAPWIPSDGQNLGRLFTRMRDELKQAIVEDKAKDKPDSDPEKE